MMLALDDQNTMGWERGLKTQEIIHRQYEELPSLDDQDQG
jgi:hypothetical protein